MTQLVIVADDLTGAADCAAPLAARASTSIVLDLDGPWPDAQVVAVDTDSRYCSADVAVTRVVQTARRGSALGARLFKKVDSTLRGNIAVELAAMTRVLGRRTPALVVLAPAFPATGRTTVGGAVHVHGVPLADRGRDGDVGSVLRRGGLRTALVPLDALTDPESLAGRYAAARAAGVQALVVDGAADAHLATVAQAARLDAGPLLLAGSGGLARSLGAAFEVGTSDGAARPARPARSGSVLLVVGSHAPEARAQLERLSGTVTAVRLADDDRASAHAVRDALQSGHAVLFPDPDEPVRPEQATEVARRLAAAALAGVERAATLVATGGETARAILTAAGADRLDVVGEREPGVVHSRVPALGIDLVTKAGAFGDADALLRCLPGRLPAKHAVRREGGQSA